MRNSNRILIAALAIAAAQFPSLGARAELAPQHQAALQQVVDTYEAVATNLQQAIDTNDFNELQTSQNPVLTNLAEQIENAENAEDLDQAGEDFTEIANGLASSGAAQFMTAEAQAEIGDLGAAMLDPDYLAHLQAEAVRLATLKKILKAIKKIVADYKEALAGDSSTEVGSSNVGMDETARQYAFRGRLAGQGAMAAAQAGRMASMANGVHRPPAYHPPAYHPPAYRSSPMVETPRITLRVEVRR